MTRSAGKQIVGVILAGGEGMRIGGGKPQRLLNGKPLLQHAADRLAPQVDELWISSRRGDGFAATTGIRIVTDDPALPRSGPVGGIAAALKAAFLEGFDRVAVVPCDAPFLPDDIVRRFAEVFDRSEAPGVVAATADGLQPTFGLWRPGAFVKLEAAVREGRLRLRELCRELGVTALELGAIEGDGYGLFNINTPADLLRAAELSPPALDLA